jgi:hypothetical protein
MYIPSSTGIYKKKNKTQVSKQKSKDIVFIFNAYSSFDWFGIPFQRFFPS